MKGENFVTLSNLKKVSDNHVEKRSYSKVGSAGTIAFALFVGATGLKCPVQGDITSDYNYSRPSYIYCINLEQEKGYLGLSGNNGIDLMRVENNNKIKKMSLFEDDWNGTGGCAFSQNAIALFHTVINLLDKQPQIAPTGRNSLLMQYELDDSSLLAFEVSENRTEKVFIPKGDYSRAQLDVFTENVGEKIRESVNNFYAIG